MLNRVLLQGRFVADPELRHTPSGVAVATFRLAVERDFKDKDTGEHKADFVSFVAWRNTGEFVSKYFAKGAMAIVEGKLATRTYQTDGGENRHVTEVIADSIYFAGEKREGSTTKAASPYAPPPATSTPPQDGFQSMEDDDGELPF